MTKCSKIRSSFVDETFYASDSDALRKTLNEWVGTPSAGADTVRALIAPHAGYMYSGAICASAYAACTARPSRIILMGPSHHVPLTRCVGCSHDGFETPLGIVPVDQERMGEWTRSGALDINDAAHRPEHALETHLPVIQVRWPETPRILPVLTSIEDDARMEEALAASLKKDDLVAVSSDLSHFLPDPEARQRDLRTAEAIEGLRPEEIASGDACGCVAVRALLRLARQNGWKPLRLAMRTSADVTGDRTSVVGYGAWVFLEEDGHA